ncbi:SIS domain-containing protein [Atopobium sp. oral taxon 810]|uniref:SIS domain-containing protein n=1 Tax=Atopobium sp. oral taxon 810 TaxID=712158 RepID=UPI0003977B8B|nr:SIS domain-containing protein [Atopobium sp. oral taxon 810]ERI05348.1 hypothetical protein HMPREF9069_00891 [Atopobium sp. oral taxon 810 str. F0209]
MRESATVEIMNFDQEGYLSDGKQLYEIGKKMKALADKVCDEGFDHLFLLGVGGTWDEFLRLQYLMNKYADTEHQVHLLHAAEWNVVGDKFMTDKSVVFTSSESGTTPEVLQAVKKMKKQSVRIYAMTNPEGPIGQAVGAENCIMMENDHATGGCEKGYYLADCFGLRILNRQGFFPKYDQFIEQTKGIWQVLLDIRKAFEPKAEAFAKKYALAPYTMFIGSGALWGETILFAMCILEEMQWKRTRYISSADFFHGTLELVEPGVPVVLFKGEDECRALDERVEAFLKSGRTGDTDITVIDTAEYGVPGLDDDFRTIISTYIISVLSTDRLARYYETVTKHNLKYRRYYHQFVY